MKMPWQKGDDSGSLVKIRAAVMPMTPGSRVVRGVSESNLTVNSVSTHIVNLQPLQPGQKAEDVAQFEPGTINQGSWMISPEDAVKRNLQRVQFNAPNWVGVLVVSNASSYERHIDIPVWADGNGKIQRVDVDALLVELEPRRKKASEIWGQREGIFSDLHQIAAAPKEIFKAVKSLAALPGDLMDTFRDIKNSEVKADPNPAEPVPKDEWPDLSQYPPVDGLDYQTLVGFQAKPETIKGTEFADKKRMLAAGKVWNGRIISDPKLAKLFFCDVDRVKKGATPSWEWTE